jgi:hypothetical protein
VGCTHEELVKNRKDAVPMEHALQAAQKAQVELDLPPLPQVQIFLQRSSDSTQNFRRELWFQGVCKQDDGGNERDLEWLFDSTITGQIQ